jgi:DNA-binding LacI/PurR family transcriptional regulator
MTPPLSSAPGSLDRVRPATIRDVAARAGVSKSVVSRVLRDAGYVSDAKQKAVRRAVQDLGYRPNAAARSLTEARSRTVGVVLNDMRNPWFVNAVDGLNAVLNGKDLQILMGDHRLDSRGGESLLRKLLEMNVDGLILVGELPPSAQLTAAVQQVPTVVLGTPVAPHPSADVVANNDVVGATLAVQHLIALGHQRIAHIWNDASPVGDARCAGYEQAMRDNGLGEMIEKVRGDFTEQGGYESGMDLLSKNSPTERPTAVFACNDMSALGLLTAADELGIAVPGDLSVVGYDNTPIARIGHISLTSIDNVSHESGRRAAELLLARLANPGRTPSVTLLQPFLEIRKSSQPPRS